ncbi:hypothetical protein F2P81_007451 [Scophthalmus maximus]|uniref:Uncharacterized protein n=1 Tax=Scophthalmus maximus TaxID=52904 RepID=A0A6A4SVF3_SCOMX|nr:hypothetical protein F2P81_007451 [Scophthalmus maximus]
MTVLGEGPEALQTPKARQKANQATMTSNLESDQEVETGRKIIAPGRYLDSVTPSMDLFSARDNQNSPSVAHKNQKFGCVTPTSDAHKNQKCGCNPNQGCVTEQWQWISSPKRYNPDIDSHHKGTEIDLLTVSD